MQVKKCNTQYYLASSFLASLLLVVNPLQADEGGVAFWFSGQYASFAATPATPGWSLPIEGYYYNGGASKNSFTRGDNVALDLDSQTPLLMIQPTYAPKTKLFGGQASIGLGIGFGENSTQAGVSVSPRGIHKNASDTTTGFTDLYPIATLAWNDGSHNWMSYLTGDIPIGDYDSTQLSNLGIGHAAIDAGGGYTYFNESTGHEFSAVLGLTYNWENPDTNYKNGIDSHLDWAASQLVGKSWQLGVAGYAYYQLTDDSGSGAKLGGFKSSVVALGPQVGYFFSMNGAPAYFNIRGYREFQAKNRVEGYSLFTMLVIPITTSK